MPHLGAVCILMNESCAIHPASQHKARVSPFLCCGGYPVPRGQVGVNVSQQRKWTLGLPWLVHTVLPRCPIGKVSERHPTEGRRRCKGLPPRRLGEEQGKHPVWAKQEGCPVDIPLQQHLMTDPCICCVFLGSLWLQTLVSQM